MLQIALIGPLGVTRDGARLTVPGGKTTELLVRLALDAGVLVRAERLVDDLWAAEAVTTRRNTLQAKVVKLRRALGEPPVLESGEGGYRLAVAPAEVDALAVLRCTTSATRLLEDGDDRAAADLCATALARFRGDLLPSAGTGEWADPHRARLEEARMTLVETQLAARVRLGDVADVVGELEEAVSRYPFQEGLWQLLITAQYRAGRQADALATYQRVKVRLADELGLDPGPGLQELERQVLRQDRTLGRGSRDVPTGNLPSLTAELVGRDADVATVSDQLTRARLVEIVGPGGIGKTALAIAVGRRATAAQRAGCDSVWLARLETAVTADDVVDTLIAALNAPGEEAMLERLRDTHAWVVLDNCEHVVDAAGDLVARLLDGAPGLRVLCTSQVPLGIDGEVVFELAPLGLPDAVALFTRRATGARSREAPEPSSEVARAVLDLCRSPDGLPLAIELAAARTRTLSVDEITRRLDDRFHLLHDPTSRRPERRRSLRSTIRWSYELLFPDDQRGLWALATFAGGAPLPAVEFVLSALDVPSAAAIDVVGRLASRSLVIVDDERGETSPGPARVLLHGVRYRLLDSIRAFALEAVTEAGCADAALAAHARWFADAAASSTLGVRGSRQAEHLAVARAERANIDAALAWSAVQDPLLGLQIVNGFGWAWVVLGDSRGAQRLVTALDAAGDLAAAPDRANALLLASWIEASTGRLGLAREHIAAAAELASAIGDVDLQARCCYYLAYVVSHDGDFAAALALTDRSRALYDGLDRPWDQVANGLFAARAAISAGDAQRGGEALERVQGWLQSVEDPWLQVRFEAALGELARVQRRFADAVLHIGRAAQTSRRLGFSQTEAYQLSSLGRAQCQAGDYDTGAATLEHAVERAEATGDVRLAALGRVHLGRVLRGQGQFGRARTTLEAAAAWHRAAGGGEQAALGECLLAALDAADGVGGAAGRLAAILDQARAADAAHVEVFALDALARVTASAGDVSAAQRLLATADRRMAAASHFITDLDRVDAHRVRSIG